MHQSIAVENYLEKYQSLKLREFPSHQDKAIGFFSRLGFPTTKNEEWKYTNVTPIIARNYTEAPPVSQVTTEEILKRFPFAENGICIVLENGKLNSSASFFDKSTQGIEILPLAEAKKIPSVEKHYNLYADGQEDAFAALNTAFANDGVVIQILAKANIEKPVM